MDPKRFLNNQRNCGGRTSQTKPVLRTSALRQIATAAAALVLLLASPLSLWPLTRAPRAELYLLGEIPQDPRMGAGALNLYVVDSGHNLERVREIVPAADPTHPGDFGDGVFAVLDDTGDKIYVTYPNIVPSTLSVIHKAAPAMKDEVEFNPDHRFVLNVDFGIAAGEGRQSYLLCTLLPDLPNSATPHPGGTHSTLVSVAGDAPGSGPRTLTRDWGLFKAFRYQGVPNRLSSDTLAYIKDGHVRVQAEGGVGPFSVPADVDVVPPFPLDTSPGNISVVAAANSRYFAFVPLVRVRKENPSGYVGAPFVCVHDRKLNTWKRVTSASTYAANSRRIFGSWLATIVEVWHSGEFEENPGPNRAPSMTSIPGVLVLDNLEDGRRIILNTAQADSEILDIRTDGLVLYRVNDTIFQAHIEGDKLTQPALVVRDDDVAAVHWVFWSGEVKGGELATPEGPPTVSAAETANPYRVRLSKEVESAKLIFRPEPEYPQTAEVARLQGVVRLNAIINTDGTIQNLRIISGHPLLVKAALDAVQRWRYVPTRLRGQLVEVETEIDVNFWLPK